MAAACASFQCAAVRTSRRLHHWLLGALALATACSNDKPVAPPKPDLLVVISGDTQSALINRRLPNSLTVQVRTADFAPRAGVPLEWTVTSGQGSLAVSAATTDAQGMASATWTLGRTVGTQAVSVRISGSTVPAASFSASALQPAPMIVRYDGTNWQTELADSNGLHVTVNAVWAASSSQVFGVGSCVETLLHLDGAKWNRAPLGCNPAFLGTSVSGRSASDVFLTTHDALPPSFGTTVWHYDGQTVTSSYMRGCTACNFSFNGVWTAAGENVFVVGDSGTTIRFDGSSWTPLASGTTNSLKAVWGSASDHVFAVGASGTILFFDGTSWSSQTSGTTETLNGVWGRSASDVFAVGTHGTLLHFDGASWSEVRSNTIEDLYGVAGTSKKVFAMGNNSTVVAFDGVQATTEHIAPSIDLRGVWVASPTTAFAVGVPH